MAHADEVARAIEIVRLAFPDEADSARYKRLLKRYADEGRVVPDATAEIIVVLLKLAHSGHEADALHRIAQGLAQQRGPDSPGGRARQ
jgi:hypothetical protein